MIILLNLLSCLVFNVFNWKLRLLIKVWHLKIYVYDKEARGKQIYIFVKHGNKTCFELSSKRKLICHNICTGDVFVILTTTGCVIVMETVTYLIILRFSEMSHCLQNLLQNMSAFALQYYFLSCIIFNENGYLLEIRHSCSLNIYCIKIACIIDFKTITQLLRY